ncbi:MAG: helix-turn-helix transcriptional regulator [Christensenella sp.]
MNIVERIKALQKEKDGKISLNALEKQLDIGKSTISSWEKKQPSADKLTKLADYFNVSTDYLLGRTENPSPYNEVIAASSSDSDFYENLTNEGRDELEKYKELLKFKYGKK